jgi:hypothetical protein
VCARACVRACVYKRLAAAEDIGNSLYQTFSIGGTLALVLHGASSFGAQRCFGIKMFLFYNLILNLFTPLLKLCECI